MTTEQKRMGGKLEVIRPVTEVSENLGASQPLGYIELHRDSVGASESQTCTGRLCASWAKIS